MLNISKLYKEGEELAQKIYQILKSNPFLQKEVEKSQIKIRVFKGINENILRMKGYVTSWERGLLFQTIYLYLTDTSWFNNCHSSVLDIYYKHFHIINQVKAIILIEKSILNELVIDVYFTSIEEIKDLIAEIELENLVDEILESEA